MRRYNIILALLLIALLSLYHGIVVKRYNFTTDKLPADASINIVHVSDFHNAVYGENQQNILRKIEKQSPDIILITGDMYEFPEQNANSRIFLEQVVDIAPCYYVTGNHEYWTYDIGDIENEIAGLGINIIDNESIVLDINGAALELFGVDDADAPQYVTDYEYDTWEDALDAVYNDKKTDNYSILLSHRPEKVDDYKKYDYDLVLCGHAHGGQVRIPLLVNGLYAPNQGWFPKYAGGKYELNETTLLVSRGLYKNWRLPRVFNPPEISLIKISGEAIS